MSKPEFTETERAGFDHWQEAARAGQRPQLEVSPAELLERRATAMAEGNHLILTLWDGIACLAVKLEGEPGRDVERYGTGRIVRCWAAMEQAPA